MIHQYHRVTVLDQIVHDAGQAHDVGRVQADGRLVQHVEHAGGAVADRAGQLHALALTGGEGGRGAVQGEVIQPQVHQAAGCGAEGLADALGHGAHFRGQAGGHAVHPLGQLGQRHRAGIGQRDTPQTGCAGGLGQTGTVAGRAGLLLEELFHTLHALFVLDLGQRVFHRVDRIIIGKVQFTGFGGVFGLIKNVFFLRRAVIDDFFLGVGQLVEGYIGAHAHGTADIGHQAPHQGIPGGDCAIVDAQRRVGYQRGQVHRAHGAGAIAGAAGPLAVECQFLGGGCAHRGPAGGANQRLSSRHSQAGRQVVTVGAAVGRQAGEHQPQAVQQLGASAEGAANARHAGPLVQR